MVCAQKKKLELEIDRELLFHEGLHINCQPPAFPLLGFVSMATRESPCHYTDLPERTGEARPLPVLLYCKRKESIRSPTSTPFSLLASLCLLDVTEEQDRGRLTSGIMLYSQWLWFLDLSALGFSFVGCEGFIQFC